MLKENERVDQLIREGLEIIQSPDYFTFSVDAILLAEFVKLPQSSKKKIKIMDFCTGTGVIPLLLSHRTVAKIDAVDIQEELVDMAQRSVARNNLQKQINVFQADIKTLKADNDNPYDIITCNPPYFLVDKTQATHKLTSHAVARHEIHLSMDDWVKKAKQHLRYRGALYIVHRPERLDDLFMTLEKHNFSISRLQFAHPKPGRQANIVLVQASLGGGRNGVKVEPAITIQDENGKYTPEMMELYFG